MAGGRRWTLPDAAAGLDSTPGRLRAGWPGGVTLDLEAEPVAAGMRLTCRASGLQPGTSVDGIGWRAVRESAPARILVDGYQSWDWAGVRDARRPGHGWWSAVWGDPGGHPARPLAIRLDGRPTTPLWLSWEAPGSLEVLTCGDPGLSEHRTGPPGALKVPRDGGLAGDPAVILPATGDASGASHPTWGGPRSDVGRLRGWMSWNCLGGDVSAPAVLEAARRLVPPGGLVLVDDGWMPRWGDWVERPGFGATLAALAAALRDRGQVLGAWVAPFLAHPESRLVAERPDLLLHDAGIPVLDPRPALSQFVLDGASPAVAAHLRELGERLALAGVGALKVDFLYAGALPGAHAGGVSGTVALGQGLEALVAGFREHAPPPAAVLACGAPLPPVAGLVDSCRSGGDAVINVPNRGAAAPPRPWFAHGRATLRAQARNLCARSWLWGRAAPCDVDAVTFGAVGDTPPVTDYLLDAWVELARRSGGPFLVSDRPQGLSPQRLARLTEELARAERTPMRPTDPLAPAPADMQEDGFLAWPDELPDEWELLP